MKVDGNIKGIVLDNIIFLAVWSFTFLQVYLAVLYSIEHVRLTEDLELILDSPLP